MSTTPMVAPDGTPGDIPVERVAEAVKAGFKVGAELKAPNGQTGVVPVDRVHEAISAGFMLQGTAPSQPQVSMQEDRGAMPGGKLQGLPGTDFSRTPTTGEAIGDVALAGAPIAGAMLASPEVAYGAGYAREALAPIVKKYGIKALEGAGLGAGWQLYHELKSVFEGPK